MVYCPSCGSANRDDARFCNTCGAEIVFDGTSKGKIDYSSQQSSSSHQQTTQSTYQPPRFASRRPRPKDEADTIIYCCAFCFPIVGLVLWIVWREERPNTANTMLILGILGFVLSFFFGLFSA